MKWTSSGGVLIAVFACVLGLQALVAKDAKETMYTGCVGGTTAHFMLNHAMMEPAEGKAAAAKSAAKEKDLMVTSTAVDLSKHIGHKVTVTGAAGRAKAPFIVKSLKMVANKCS
jgi:hypothetical protein